MAASSAQYAIRVLDQSLVSPPKGSVANTALPLTFLDIFWLYGPAVERIFFYPLSHSTAHFIDNILPGLKYSLSFALQHFFPLAGKVRLSPGSENQYEIYYTDGDSVSLTLAECDGDFEKLSGSHARELAGLQALVPRIRSSDVPEALLALQATVFPNHGISLGVAVHHVAGDGASSMHFLKSWAAACRTGGSLCLIPPPPVYDRTAIADPRNLYSIVLNDMRRIRASLPDGASDIPKQQEAVFLSTFTLSREHIEQFKRRVSARAMEGKAPFHFSTFVMACAYVWVCLTKSRGELSDDKIVDFGCAADCRRRLEPPVPQAYFGNCLGTCFAKAKAGDLRSVDGFVIASEAIRRGIEKLGEGVFKDVAEGWLLKIATLLEHKPLSVAGSPKFRVYDVDFGWGKPEKVEVISIIDTGAISLAESREEEGGIQIGVAMPKAELDEFVSHFSEGLELTSVMSAGSSPSNAPTR